MFKSLRSQLSLSILTLTLVIIVLMTVFANILASREFDRYMQRQDEARSETIVKDLSNQYNDLTGVWDSVALHTVGMYALYSGYIVKVYDASGAALWDAEHHDITLCGQIMDEITKRMAEAEKTGSFQTHTFPMTRGQVTIGSVTVSYYTPFFYTANDNRFLDALNTVFLAIGLVAAALAVALGWMLARRVAQPVAKAAETAGRIAQGEYGNRIGRGTGTLELDHLIRSINHLAAALETQETLRKRLINDVAHELRTPLTAVSLHLEAMIDGLWEATPERLKSCHEELTRLGELVKDIQQLANAEGDSPKLRLAPVDLLKLAETVAGSLSAQAQAKSQTLTVTGGPAVAEADGERMRQVLVNLIANAIKFTPEGGHIRVETGDRGDTVYVSVRDDGIGIDEADQPLIFERFYRVDESRDRRTGGTGIGLAIAKSVVLAHGGTIGVESRKGAGSTFTVSLPKKRS